MFKDRTYLKIALAVLVLALGVSARFYLHRPVPYIDRSVPCIWDANDLKGKPDTCEGQDCGPIYSGGTKNGLVMDGKIIHCCCPKGYTPALEENPTTHVSELVCRKN